MPFATTEGVGRRIYYEETGRGDTVLLMPGWAGSIIELDRLRGELSAGFRVVAADLPGSGRSEPQPRHYAPSFYLDDARAMAALLDEVRAEVAHLVGFSDGGEVALAMAALEPSRALSVLTWGAAGQVVAAPGMLDEVARVVDAPSEPLKGLAAYLVEAYGVATARVMTKSWARALAAIVESGGDITRSRASMIRCAALLVAGTYDPVCPPALVREMADAMPRGEFREAPGAGHDVHVSHPDWLVSTVVDWLSQH